MRIPPSLASLIDDGIIDDVVRPLMSGKEAEVYLVLVDDEERVAKVYKDAQQRTFKNRAVYSEGRRTRDSREQRAMGKQSRFGKAQEESAWRATEYTMIRRLQAAGVRVPVPYHFVDGVLVMELVTDAEGYPASRLGELDFTPEEAQTIHDQLLREVVRMLCAGIVHGDLSDFNVLLGADGPVIIDFPQAVDSAVNQSAPELLRRDVDNIHRFLCRFVPSAPRKRYADEMWALYRQDQLTPDTVLTGRHQPAELPADITSVMDLIEDANRDEWERVTRKGQRVMPRELVRFGEGTPEQAREATRRGPVDVRPERPAPTPDPSASERPRAPGRPGFSERSGTARPGFNERSGGHERTGGQERPARPGDRHVGNERLSGNDRPARPGDRHVGNERLSGNDRPARPGDRPGNDRTPRPGDRPGNDRTPRPGDRPGNDRPSGNDRRGRSGWTEHPGSVDRPGDRAGSGDRPGAQERRDPQSSNTRNQGNFRPQPESPPRGQGRPNEPLTRTDPRPGGGSGRPGRGPEGGNAPQRDGGSGQPRRSGPPRPTLPQGGRVPTARPTPPEAQPPTEGRGPEADGPPQRRPRRRPSRHRPPEPPTS